MTILIAILAFALGMVLGVLLVYKKEKKIIEDLVDRCAKTRAKLEEMHKEEAVFIESMWPKQNPYISSVGNVADYLKEKYLAAEDNCGPDFDPECEVYE